MEMKEKRETVEVDLRRLLRALWQHAWLILLCGILCGSIAFGYAWFTLAPTYSASVKFYVNNQYADSLGFSSSQMTAAQELANTYMVIMGSRTVLNAVIEETGLPYSVPQLQSMIKAQSVNETEVFRVSVVSHDYKHAAQIANGIAAVLPEKLPAIVDGSSVRIVEHAEENPTPTGPNYRRYLVIGAFFGIVLAAAFVIASVLLDTTIEDEEYLTQAYSTVPLLAVIPDAEDAKHGGYKGYSYKGYYELEKERRGGTA